MIVEKDIILEVPEQVEGQPDKVVLPVASYSSPGIASFNKDYFKIVNGKVNFRYDVSNAIKSFEVTENGVIKVVKSDNTTEEYILPVNVNGEVTSKFIKEITFEESSFVDDDGMYKLVDKLTDKQLYFITLQRYKDGGYEQAEEDFYVDAHGNVTMTTTIPFKGRFLIIDSVFVSNLKLDKTLSKENEAADAKVVGEELLKKLTIVKETSSRGKAYIIESDGSSKTELLISGTPKANGIARYDAAGRLSSYNAINQYDVVNKSQADKIEGRVDLLFDALNQDNILAEVELSESYTERFTARGKNIVNEQKTIVSKIQGVSVVSENLITFTPFSKTDYYIDFTLDENGVLTASGAGQSGPEPFVYVATFVAPKTGTYYFSADIERGATSKNNENIALFDDMSNFVTSNTQFSATEGQIFQVTFTASSVYYEEYDVYVAPADCVITMAIYAEPVIQGVKNSYFKGIESYGGNLFNIHGITGLKNTGGADKTSYLVISDRKINVKIGMYSEGVYFTGNEPYLKAGKYTISFDVDMNSASGTIYAGLFNPRTREYIHLKFTAREQFLTYHLSGTIDVPEDGIYYFSMEGSGAAGTSTKLDIEFYNVRFEQGTIVYGNSEKDNSFMLNTSVELLQYDYIDVQNKKLIKQSGTLTKDTPFTNDELSEYEEYVLSKDRKTIVYKLDKSVTSNLSINPSYKVWVNGAEKIITGSSGQSVEPIITQSYFVLVGGNK